MTLEELAEKLKGEVSAIRSKIDETSNSVNALKTETVEQLRKDNETFKIELSALKAPTADKKAENVTLENRYTKDFHQYMMSGAKFDDAYYKRDATSGNSTTDAQGGYLCPDGLDKRVVELIANQSVFRANASVMTTEGNKYERPYQTSGIDCAWVAESAARAQTNAQTYEMITATLGELYAFPMYTQRFLADAWANVEQQFLKDLANAFTDKEETAFLSGDGTDKPKGILTYDMVTTADKTRAWNKMQKIITGSATDITLDSLISTKDSLNRMYKQNAKWYMSTATYTALQDNLKDSTGRRIFGGVDVATDAPTMLLGYPIEIDDYMPDIAASSLPIMFGDLASSYLILDRPGIGVVRDNLTNKPYIGMYSIKRTGGLVQDYRGMKFVSVAVS